MVEASWSTMVGLLTSHKKDPMCEIFCLRTAGFGLAGWHPEGLSDYDSVKRVADHDWSEVVDDDLQQH